MQTSYHFAALQQKLIHHPLVRFFVGFPDILLISLLLLGAYWLTQQQHQQRMALFHQPLINDFYFVDYYQIDPASDAKFRYLPLKVTDINTDGIAYVRGNKGFNKAVSVTKQVQFDAPMNRNYFASKPQRVSYQTLQDWFQRGIIYDIARPESFYINGWIVLSRHEVVRGEKRNQQWLLQQKTQG